MASAPTAPSVAQDVMALERDYLLQNYGRYPVVLHRGKGCYLYSTDGQRYLDLISGIGVNALGHAHPRILKVLREQAGLLIHTSNLYYHEFQGPLARKLCETSGLQRVFFCNSGTEATEATIKMIRSHGNQVGGGKREMISLQGSFHGRTMGALSVTGQEKYRAPFEPMLDGVHFVPRNDVAALEQVCCEKTAGILLEAVQGEGGVNALSESYLRKARELADKYDALLTFDETQCGVGRLGTYFAYQVPDPVVMPDVIWAAKPIACGLPLGFVACTEKAAATIAPGMHGSTFGGNALACRVALEFFEILDELLPQIQQTGAYFRMRLQELAKHYTFIREVRGMGLMIGMELDIPGKQIVLDALEAGLLINCTHDTVLRFLPPYIITEQEVDRAVEGLRGVLAKV